eukprot:7380298-Prymnesium_polylepis.1
MYKAYNSITGTAHSFRISLLIHSSTEPRSDSQRQPSNGIGAHQLRAALALHIPRRTRAEDDVVVDTLLFRPTPLDPLQHWLDALRPSPHRVTPPRAAASRAPRPRCQA